MLHRNGGRAGGFPQMRHMCCIEFWNVYNNLAQHGGILRIHLIGAQTLSNLWVAGSNPAGRAIDFVRAK